MNNSNQKKTKYRILKGFCFESAKGDAVYIPKKVHQNSGHKVENVLSLPKEAIKLGKKLKAIKAI